VQVTEHRSARLVVHLGLEFVLVLERDGTLCCRPGADLIDLGAIGELYLARRSQKPG
jgi:hypothetical protein